MLAHLPLRLSHRLGQQTFARCSHIEHAFAVIPSASAISARVSPSSVKAATLRTNPLGSARRAAVSFARVSSVSTSRSGSGASLASASSISTLRGRRFPRHVCDRTILRDSRDEGPERRRAAPRRRHARREEYLLLELLRDRGIRLDGGDDAPDLLPCSATTCAMSGAPGAAARVTPARAGSRALPGVVEASESSVRGPGLRRRCIRPPRWRGAAPCLRPRAG